MNASAREATPPAVITETSATPRPGGESTTTSPATTENGTDVSSNFTSDVNPKFKPVIVTVVPPDSGPDTRERPAIVGRPT